MNGGGGVEEALCVGGWVDVKTVCIYVQRAHTTPQNWANTHRVLVEGEDAEVDVVARERAGQDVERDGDALVLLLYFYFIVGGGGCLWVRVSGLISSFVVGGWVLKRGGSR